MIPSFYITDDDLSVQRILKSIIEKHDLGTVMGCSDNGKTAIQEIQRLQPDIVLVDLLMPQVDGIGVVSCLHQSGCSSSFIMISQVNSCDMISNAYDEGIEFFISKPINVVEVVAVIKNVIEKHSLTQMLHSFESAMKTVRGPRDFPHSPLPSKDTKSYIRMILANLGISGEAGCQDLIQLIYLLTTNQLTNLKSGNVKMADAYQLVKDHYQERGSIINPGTIEQRIRRSIKSALNNLAHRGLEDYHDDIFIQYSTLLFEFAEVRKEMDYLKRKSPYGGKISVRKFVEGIQILLSDLQ